MLDHLPLAFIIRSMTATIIFLCCHYVLILVSVRFFGSFHNALLNEAFPPLETYWKMISCAAYFWSSEERNWKPVSLLLHVRLKTPFGLTSIFFPLVYMVNRIYNIGTDVLNFKKRIPRNVTISRFASYGL